LPTVLRIGGHRFFFYSEEGREPPHIHVKTAGNYAKFWLEPVELAESFGYNRVHLRRLHDIVENHRLHFLEEWHEHFKD
jgi:hypothetical protein